MSIDVAYACARCGRMLVPTNGGVCGDCRRRRRLEADRARYARRIGRPPRCGVGRPRVDLPDPLLLAETERFENWQRGGEPWPLGERGENLYSAPELEL